jgi:lysine 2,3-aminomutase
LQNPERIDENVYSIFRKHSDRIHFELATQINHPVDLFPESIEIFKKIRDLGVIIYSQNVLLKGLNDDIDTLAALYNKMRDVGVESHYLFHCVPMKGMGHFRNHVSKGIELVKQLTNSGIISGRSKPMFALMTDIGKIIMYEGTILDKKENMIQVQSTYQYTERLKNNPSWEMPDTAEVDENGFLRIWYLDGNDD